MAKKIALLIGVSEYGAGIPPLLSALNDVEAMERVLQNPNLGNFAQVERLLNPDSVAMRIAIQKLFKNAGKEDLLLFFFSGHGITNDDNHLYLATRNTAKDDFEATAVDANFIQTQSKNCYSKRQVLILDACYSGAFASGWHTKSIGVDIKKQLGAEGRVVLTSSGATQTSFAQEGATLSLYTQYLVEGIETGAADTDNDGNIHVQELHTYAKSKVQAVKPNMTPDIILDKEGYNILLAYAPKNPEVEYRKLVEQYAQNGELSEFAFFVLKPKRKTLGITDTTAEEIETEVLEPFRKRLANLQSYKQAFAKAVEQKYPLDEHILNILKDYQQDVLGLRDEDVASIELEITSVKEAEYQKQREEEALQLQQQAKALSQLRLQQEAERLQRQREVEAAEKLRLQQEAEVEDRKLVEQPEPEPHPVSLNLEYKKPEEVKLSELIVDLGQGITLELVRVPAGKFTMGIPPQERKIALENVLNYGVGVDTEKLEQWLDWSTPHHEVHLQEFLMGKYTVTNAQWRAVMKTNPSEKYDRKFQGDMQPVVGISWYEARAFCQKLSQHTGRNVRLPIEAEWEYACCAGTTTPFAFGNNITTNQVNYDGNNPYGDAPKGKYRECTVDVNSFSPNSWHLYQMHGNVWEWCLDRWHDSYSQKPKHLKSYGNEVWGETNVDEHDNLPRSVRGGSWCYDAFDCRSTNRCLYRAKDSDHDIGFRVVFESS
jgi:formylglycine-generating enzyme required for sulfatase activity